MKKSLVAFHAKEDCPEVRMMVFGTLAELDFSAQVIVGRKSEPMFCSRYKGNRDLFYHDEVSATFPTSEPYLQVVEQPFGRLVCLRKS